jgi:hypothetical protein
MNIGGAAQLFSAGVGFGLLLVWSCRTALRAGDLRAAWKVHHSNARESRTGQTVPRLDVAERSMPTD